MISTRRRILERRCLAVRPHRHVAQSRSRRDPAEQTHKVATDTRCCRQRAVHCLTGRARAAGRRPTVAASRRRPVVSGAPPPGQGRCREPARREPLVRRRDALVCIRFRAPARVSGREATPRAVPSQRDASRSTQRPSACRSRIADPRSIVVELTARGESRHCRSLPAGRVRSRPRQ